MKSIFLSLVIVLLPFLIDAQVKSYYKFSDEEDKYLYGYKNTETNEILIEAKYHKVKDYFNSYGFSLVKIDDKYGAVNKYGEEIVPVIYTRVFLDKGYIRVKKGGGYYNDERGASYDGKYGLYDSLGNIIVHPTTYDYLGKPSSGLLRANVNGIDYLSSGGTFSGEDVEVTGGKWGFIDINGRRAIPFKYTYAYNFNDELAQVYVGGTNTDWVYGGEWNYIRKNGELIIKDGLQKEEAIQNGIVIVSETKEEWIRQDDGYRDKFNVKYYGAVNTQGDFVLKPKYKNIEILLDKYFMIEDKKGNVEIHDLNLKALFDFEIENASSLIFNAKKYLEVKLKNGGLLLFNQNLEQIFDSEYEKFETDNLKSQSYLKAYKNKKIELLNSDFEIILPAEYEDIGWFADFYPDYRFIVKKNGKWGKVNSNNKVLIPFEYDKLKPTQIESEAKIYWVEKDGKQGLINENNEVFLNIYFDEIPDNYNISYAVKYNRIRVKLNGKQALIDKNGEFIFPAKFTEINTVNWEKNRAEVKNEKGKKGISDTLGNIIVNPEYEEIRLGPEMYVCQTDDEWHLIDANQKKLIGIFSDYNSFAGFQINNQYAAALKKDGKYGYVNTVTGDIVFDFIFDEIMNDNFYCGVNRVKIDDKYGLINNKAEIVFEAEFNELERNDACVIDADGVRVMNFYAKKRRKWGIVNKDGEIVTDFKYKNREDLLDL